MKETEKPAPPEHNPIRFGLSEGQFFNIALAWVIFVFVGYCFTIYFERGERIIAILKRFFSLL
ncbi:MAG: hypothetical protein ACKO0V_07525 [bacterium]